CIRPTLPRATVPPGLESGNGAAAARASACDAVRKLSSAGDDSARGAPGQGGRTTRASANDTRDRTHDPRRTPHGGAHALDNSVDLSRSRALARPVAVARARAGDRG